MSADKIIEQVDGSSDVTKETAGENDLDKKVSQEQSRPDEPMDYDGEGGDSSATRGQVTDQVQAGRGDEQCAEGKEGGDHQQERSPPKGFATGGFLDFPEDKPTFGRWLDGVPEEQWHGRSKPTFPIKPRQHFNERSASTSRCYNCNSLEHRASECTVPRTCYICRQTGHISSGCPRKRPIPHDRVVDKRQEPAPKKRRSMADRILSNVEESVTKVVAERLAKQLMMKMSGDESPPRRYSKASRRSPSSSSYSESSEDDRSRHHKKPSRR